MRGKAIIFGNTEQFTYGFALSGRECAQCYKGQGVVIGCSCPNQFCLWEDAQGKGDCMNCFLNCTAPEFVKIAFKNLISKLNPIELLELEQ